MIILAVSVLFTIFYRPLADMFGAGFSSYERFRLWGLIGCGLGLIVLLNIHTMIIEWFLSMLFHPNN